MKVTRIEVENFKSIENYDLIVKDFNVFVGKNNHGKTNLFDALDWFDSGKTTPENYRDHNQERPIKVRIHFTGVQETLASLPDGAHKTAMQNILNKHDDFIVEKSSETDKRVLIIGGEAVANPRGFDSSLNYFLPKIVYVTTKQKLSDVAGYKSKSPIAEMLSGVLTDMVDNEPRYQIFLGLFDELFNTSESIFRVSVNDLQQRVETYLSKQFAEGAKVTFRIENPAMEDMLKKFETEIDDGIKTKAEAKGDGMQRAVMLAIVQAYADYRIEKEIARNFIFLIDEAELHLHPTAQRSLKKALRDIVDNGGQVLINSHSSIFANEVFPNQTIFKVEKDKGVSNVSEIVGEQEQLDSIYQLLGGSPSDILLPSNFIIVEGKSDHEFVQKIIKRFYSNNVKANRIKIIFAGGDIERANNLYHSIHEAYKPLLTNGVYKTKIVLLLDQPDATKTAQLQEFRRTHPYLVEGEQLHLLPVSALEMYYPEPNKKTRAEVNGMTDAKAKVNLANIVGGLITEVQFREEMPIVFNMIGKAIEFAYE